MNRKTTPFYVHVVRAGDGERQPVLVDRSTGLPDFDAVLWVTSSLRGKNLASETIIQALRSLIVFYLFLRIAKVNLDERIRAGELLEPGEIEVLTNMCGQSVSSSVSAMQDGVERADVQTIKVSSSLEKFRMTMRTSRKGISVSPATMAIRLGYIREFLRWRVSNAVVRAEYGSKDGMIALRDIVDDELRNKTPTRSTRATVEGRRLGLTQAAQQRLLDVVVPSNPQNPWTGAIVRLRNQFIANAFLALGVRRGELLGLRIGDFNPHKQEVLILRRPDDPHDPRLHEPNTKTRDRVLPVSYHLHILLKNYVLVRNEIVRGKHDYLIVSNNGAPMSKSEVNRIFSAVLKVVSEPISPHVLRHSFFENLADELFRAGESDAQIHKILTRLGGWSDSSDSPTRYTQRFSQERAFEAGLSLQTQLYIRDTQAFSDE